MHDDYSDIWTLTGLFVSREIFIPSKEISQILWSTKKKRTTRQDKKNKNKKAFQKSINKHFWDHWNKKCVIIYTIRWIINTRRWQFPGSQTRMSPCEPGCWINGKFLEISDKIMTSVRPICRGCRSIDIFL